MKTKVQMKGLDLGMLHKNLFHRKNKKWKNKKTFCGQKWWFGRRGDWISQLHTQKGQDFRTSAAAAQLITHKSSESRTVDLTNNGMGNHYLRDVDHGSTVLRDTGHHLSQTCPTRHLKVKIYEDTCEVPCTTQKDNEFERQQTSHSPLWITTETLYFVCRSPVRNTR